MATMSKSSFTYACLYILTGCQKGTYIVTNLKVIMIIQKSPQTITSFSVEEK